MGKLHIKNTHKKATIGLMGVTVERIDIKAGKSVEIPTTELLPRYEAAIEVHASYLECKTLEDKPSKKSGPTAEEIQAQKDADQKVIDDAAAQKVIDDQAAQKLIDDAAKQKQLEDEAAAQKLIDDAAAQKVIEDEAATKLLEDEAKKAEEDAAKKLAESSSKDEPKDDKPSKAKGKASDKK